MGDAQDMPDAAVVELLALLQNAGISAWIGGGWGVDALVGQQTRPHGDVDLAVDADALDRLVVLLGDHGFHISVDWLPSRLELTAPDGRCVDVHPVRFEHDGSAVQAGLDGANFRYAADAFTTGVIDGSTVPCLSAAQQLEFRRGYELRDVDRHDIPLLEALLRDPGGHGS
ncbi:nucleotidyltransferase domain-containing protein [Planctomonas psychrotolerans]|uniref:nucleotidyltransferase domain-containing protein n=1 Tax=Planctomonas psychrotolerans TaxID=2528712 RepID=UPI001D0CE5EE|nr:amino acid transporter [Planctomonas psychrotolerans]